MLSREHKMMPLVRMIFVVNFFLLFLIQASSSSIIFKIKSWFQIKINKHSRYDWILRSVLYLLLDQVQGIFNWCPWKIGYHFDHNTRFFTPNELIDVLLKTIVESFSFRVFNGIIVLLVLDIIDMYRLR